MLFERFARAAIAIAAGCTAIVVGTALLPIWPFVLFEHFRVQVAIGGVLLVIAAFALRSRAADVLAIATLVTLIAIVPDLASSRRPLAEGEHVRLLSLNVLTQNRRHDDVVQLIERERPDVVALVEVNQRWLDAIAPALVGYARIEGPREDNVGVALYARGALHGEVRSLTNLTPNIFAEVTIGAATFRVVVVHPVPPMNARFHEMLVGFFAELGGLVRGDPRVVVAGDFNATPWSRPYATMIRASDLCDSRAGFGAQTSFPADGAILRIPIDHVLTSCAIGVADRRIGSAVGSDHLPVVVDLIVPP